MVNFCSVFNCSNISNGEKVSFHSIPKIITCQGERTVELTTARRTAWLAQIKRKDFTPSKHTRICSDHFVSGNNFCLFDTMTNNM